VSLRRRVLLGGLLVIMALAAADVFVAVTVRSYLLGRVDRQLQRGGAASGAVFAPHLAERFPTEVGRRVHLVSDFYLELRDADGKVVHQARSDLQEDGSTPRLSPETVLAHQAGAGGTAEPFTAPSERGGGSWRVAASTRPDGSILVVAINLADTQAAIRRVILIELGATAGVLVAAGLVARWVLRQGVRPLGAMAATAGAIAAGDLSHRVEHVDPRTEAGQLGTAFNHMLEQIEEAFAQRESSEERLRRFVADASHELRTPLTSIQGYTDLWHQGGLRREEQLGEAMRRMGSEAHRMGLLVDDLLLLARLDQGRPLERAQVRLDLLAADAVADAQAVEPDRPIDLTAQPVTVQGDEPRLRQVVGNLLANARIHTPAGTPVHVGVTTADGWARLEVADKGPGLASEQAARVFERFYRADPGRSRARGGSGLGLSIVAAVAESHGGHVTIDTAPGEGARFVVHLPLG
jgi:two-component system OmpR family sensor kinase